MDSGSNSVVGRRGGFQRFSTAANAIRHFSPAPPSTSHSSARAGRRGSEDRTAAAAAAAANVNDLAATQMTSPSTGGGGGGGRGTSPHPDTVPHEGSIIRTTTTASPPEPLPPADGQQRHIAVSAADSPVVPRLAPSPPQTLASDSAATAAMSRWRTQLAHTHGLAGPADVFVVATADANHSSSGEQHARLGAPAVAGAEESPPMSRRNSRSRSNGDATVIASSDVMKLAEPIVVVEEECVEGIESPTTSLLGTQLSAMDGDLAPEVMEACAGLLHRLPEALARSIVRAVTLQTATLEVPQRLLRAPLIFDSYVELKGEVALLTNAHAGKTTASGPGHRSPPHLAAPGSVDLQQLLTVAPTVLHYRLQNTRNTKVGELRASFRNNAQMATRTEASISRYAYLPHVQRDVHFGATVALGVVRDMAPGPRLLGCGGSHVKDGVPLDSTAPLPHPLGGTSGVRRDLSGMSMQSLPGSVSNIATAAATAVPVPTRTYAAVSFEGIPSIFLKDRYDAAQEESAAAAGGAAAAAAASVAGNNSGSAAYRSSGRRRRRISPFFEREFIATLACGQEDAALFAATLAPEFVVGLPSFLKHPERAVPLGIAAALHHLYTIVSAEVLLRTAAAAAARSMADVAGCGASDVGLLGDTAEAEQSVSLVGTPEKHSTIFTAAAPPSPALRGPPLELGIAYARNTIVCSATTPGMESYVIFLHQLVYADPHGSGTSGRRDAAAAAAAPPPCRAIVQLSEEANGNMAAPAMPPSAAAAAAPGTFDLPTLKHAAVELTQLVSWVQDERSHDPRFGQPYLCHLTFAPTVIPGLATPTPVNLCQPLPTAALEDADAFPCAVVVATLDLWLALSPPTVSNLLRVCFVLDRHAQRVMELESPDYAVPGESGAAAAAAVDDANAAAAPTPIPFPDPRLRQHIAGAAAPQVRAYLAELPPLAEAEGNSAQQQQQQQQRLLSFFTARVFYYEALTSRYCKTDEEIQREELQRMAQARSRPASPPPPADPPTPWPASPDVYNVKMKPLCDALAAVLAAEAAFCTHDSHPRSGVAATASAPWLQGSTSHSYASVSDAQDSCSRRGDDTVVAASSSVVVVLVPLRDVQRR